jgi:hypothetical protein
MCEDQVFALKAAMGARISVTDRVTLLYRRHPAACCSVSLLDGTDVRARITFLRWAQAYVAAQDAGASDLQALMREQLWHARRSVGALGVVNRALRHLAPPPLVNWIRRHRQAGGH